MISKVDKICKGCSLFNKEFCFIVVPTKDKDHLRAVKDCPCRECLIKAMCSKICNTRFDFYKDKISNDSIFKKAMGRTEH